MTAVLAEHDSFAYDILLCCLDVGISVPQTLNVCGFDNNEWASALSNNNPSFSITTIAQDQATIGKEVAKLLQRSWCSDHTGTDCHRSCSSD